MKVGLIVGSLRKDSWNKKVAEVVQALFPAGHEVEFIDISNVPLYNEDLDGEEPHVAYTALREAVKKYDAYLFFTPEYNRSYTPAIKNVIDIVSRTPGGNPFAKKGAGVISASIGGYGGMAANHALRQAFIFVDLIPMQQPEVYLSRIDTLFDAEGNMLNSTKEFLHTVVIPAFIAHAEQLRK